MNKKILLVLGLLGIWSIVLACESSNSTNYNGKTGSANETNASCQSIGKDGECSGQLNGLTGTYYKDVQNKNIRISDKQVEVTVKVTVGSGSVHVYVLDSQGKETAVDVKAGETGTLQGKAPLTSSRFKVFFETGTEKADKVDFTISYKTTH